MSQHFAHGACIMSYPTLLGDHREGAAGDIQKEVEEESEEVEDELEEQPDVDGKEKRAIDEEEGVASSLGDFS